MEAELLEKALRDLRSALSNKNLVVVTGAGVSLGATGGASKTWPALIQHALEYAKLCCQLDFEDQTDCGMVDLSLKSKRPGTLLHAASIVQSILVKKQKFPTWLNTVFSDLVVKEDSVLYAIKRLEEKGALLVTTNYDHILDDFCGLSWIGPTDHDKMLRFMDRSRRGILHVHGEYEDPKNVVMGASDYYRIVNSADVQRHMQSFFVSNTVLFVGCGPGLTDPNFGSLIKWIAEQRQNLPEKHYMLVRRSDRDLQFPSIQRVEYDEFDKIAPLLDMIAESPRSTRTHNTQHSHSTMIPTQVSEAHPVSSKLVISAEDRRRTYLNSLKFDKIDDRWYNIDDAHMTTCKWFLRKREYQDWRDTTKFSEHHGFLWIKGKPGTGKSTLMKFALAEAKKTTPDSIVISFFFNARGEHIERSMEGMYRSLLYQLLTTSQPLQAVLDTLSFPVPDEANSSRWNIKSTQVLFRRAIENLGQSSLTCFIDALDECKEDEVRRMIGFFEKLGQVAASSRVNFSTCFSSRHYPHITIERSIQLVLETQDGHEQDMTSYLDSALKAGPSKQLERIKVEILQRSSGIFLWVVLVVRVLNKEYDSGRLYALRKRLAEIPRGLDELFTDILKRDSENIEDLVLCLQWILYAERPLECTECHFAILAGTNPEAITAWKPGEITEEDMDRFILSSSKGLAEVTKSEVRIVQFIHQSVRDFLHKNGLGTLQPNLGENFPGLSHERLKECCHTYLSIAAADHLPTTSEGFPFLEYAARNVLHHANVASTHGISQNTFVEQFPLRLWIALINLCTPSSYTANASMLYILAEQGFLHLIHIELEQMVYPEGADEYHGYAITVASVHGHKQVVKVLLDYGILPNMQGGYYGSAIQAASARGHKDIVLLLLHYGADVNALGGVHGSALQAASFSKKEQIVEILLCHGADANSENEFESALYMASERGSERIVNLLLHHGAHANAQGGYFGSALHMASANGHEHIVDVLLRHGADVETGGGLYGSALQAASANGKVHIVEKLLSSGADVDAQGGHYGSALEAAVFKGRPDMIELLLCHGANANAHSGPRGSALQIARADDRHEIVDLLLYYGAKEQ